MGQVEDGPSLGHGRHVTSAPCLPASALRKKGWLAAGARELLFYFFVLPHDPKTMA
jgi:hypothetical protein